VSRGDQYAARTWRRTAADLVPIGGIVCLAVVLAILVGSFIQTRVTELLSSQLVARATDQVDFGLLPRVSAADFDPPYTPARLDELSGRLKGLLDRARESDSGVIRVNLFGRDGTVLYSDVASLRGQVVSPLADQHLAAALAGVPGAEISSLSGAENADLAGRYHTALEAYVPCIIDDRVVGAFEFYADVDMLRPVQWSIWISLGLSFTLLTTGALVLAPFGRMLGGKRTLTLVDSALPGPMLVKTGLVRLHAGAEAGAVSSANGLTAAVECWLTRREMEVLRLLATPSTYRQIAADLSLSEETVRSHVKSILHKLKQPDRTRAVAAARRAGILPTSDLELPHR
jgi:DNA-binding CsgD family transcriptional regulator